MKKTCEVRTRDGTVHTCEVVELNTEEMVELADLLDALQAVENDGRGVCHLKTVVVYLRREQYKYAFNVYQIEGDKTGEYPHLRDFLAERMGCRTHGVRNCPGWLCRGILK